MNCEELTTRIKNFALDEAGFDQVGISSAQLPEFYGEALERWIKKGHAGSMKYMVRDGIKRASPEAILPGAKSVIVLTLNYFHPEDPKPVDRPVGKVAKYAYGTDYHKIIEKKLKTLAKFIKESKPGVRLKYYVDTGPVLERAFAREAGLGFIGKNTNLITKDFGSWVFLACILLDTDLVYDTPHTGSCGSCRICIDACPTTALLGNYELDARRCISYLTIESKEDTPQDLKRKLGEWIFGCDICQDVCPYNFRAKTTRHAAFYPEEKAGSWVELEKIEKMKDETEFKSVFQGSALKRPKLSGMLRSSSNIVRIM